MLNNPFSASFGLLAIPQSINLLSGFFSRCYIANFWEKGTAFKTYGQLHKIQKLNKHNHPYKIRKSFYRIKEPTRIERYSFDARMKSATGRRMLMSAILDGKWFIAEA